MFIHIHIHIHIYIYIYDLQEGAPAGLIDEAKVLAEGAFKADRKARGVSGLGVLGFLGFRAYNLGFRV